MDFQINGDYEAYLYVVLLQLSILYLQRLDLNVRMALGTCEAPSGLLKDYLLTTRIVGTALNWASWLLALYVGNEFGLASAALFFVLGFGSSIIATLLIPPLPRVDVIAHVLSLPTTIVLYQATLASIGIRNAI
jgi:hypothetical protein